MEIEELIRFYDKLSQHYSEKLENFIPNTDIEDALYILLSDKEKYEWRGDLWETNITFEDAILLLNGFDFSTLKNLVETQQNIISEDLIFKRKVKIKTGGLIWIIHRYDADPFPSSPHAHNLENNLKVDLSNGKCYRVRKHVITLNKKALIDFRTKASKVYKGELPSLRI
ncbi:MULTISPECIES: hypothetical protein [unclassified Paraflavitalea]|uniref:hypothetical protein n=1 Tax=unclassified Paraflavitalea TaxID=2798305 RepID=UPI003D34BD07